MFNLPEELKVVQLNTSAANAVACDVISCKTANKVWFLIHHTGANDTDLTLTLTEYTAVGGSASTVTVTCPIWTMIPSTANDEWTRATDAAAVAIDPATQSPFMAIIEWDPAKHTEGYDCITLADSGGHASNTCVVLALVDTKYKSTSPPSVIVD
jgi:hypothetical protein